MARLWRDPSETERKRVWGVIWAIVNGGVIDPMEDVEVVRSPGLIMVGNPARPLSLMEKWILRELWNMELCIQTGAMRPLGLVVREDEGWAMVQESALTRMASAVRRIMRVLRVEA